jgi:SpoVK/Ycf46/Vps4 family AAA+-type ATPase
MPAFKNSKEHLKEELALIELHIKRQITIMKLANPSYTKFDEFSGMYISEDEINGYLDRENKPADARQVYNHKAIKALTTGIQQRRKEIDKQVAFTLARGTKKETKQEVRLCLPGLKERFQLTGTELNILLCCLAPDIDFRFERYFAYLQNDVSRRRPTIQLLARMFLGEKDAVFEARGVFNKETGLLGKNLFNFNGSGDETPFPAQQLVVADSVIDFLLESDHLDTFISEIGRLSEPQPMDMYAGYFNHHVLVLESLARQYEDQGKLAVTYIGGPEGAGKRELVETFAGMLNKKVLTVDYHGIMAFQGDTRRLLALVERESILHDAVLHISIHPGDELSEPASEEKSKDTAIKAFLRQNRLEAVILTGTTDYSRIKNKIGGSVISFFIPMPNVEERYELWSRLLAPTTPGDEKEWLTGLAVKFRFTPGRIRSVLNSAALMAHSDREDKPVVHLDDIYRCCREESHQGLLSYSRKIVPLYQWKDIILPDDTLTQLKEICRSVRDRRQVYWEWGFEKKFSLGKGLNILLAGPPGIGKTMSAEIIAGELGLDLYRIDLSCVVSKYIGETEKNLSKIFKEAETGNCILFFDEADALFGKRTEVRDSHDRYANIEINYLLQKMDEYNGIVLLATNMRKNLDTAFTRRLHHVVEFPFPDEKYRGLIWKNAFPGNTPKADDIDYNFLAGKFKLAGGNIKNIAVNSAFLASANGGKVNMESIILALKREYQKMGKMCSKSDFGQYYSLVRETRE